MIPLSLLAVLPAFSSTILPLTAEQVLERSSVVVVATVTEAVPWFDPVGTVVRTDLVLDGVEVLSPGQGAFVPERLTFTGGYLDGWESIVPGMPEWPIGARAVFFVEGDGESEACPTVGWGQGLFTVEARTGTSTTRASSRSRTAPTTRSPAPRR